MMNDEIDRLAAALIAAMRWHQSQNKSLSKGNPSGSSDWQRAQHIEQEHEIRDALGPHLERVEAAEANRWRLEKIAEHESEIARLKSEMV